MFAKIKAHKESQQRKQETTTPNKTINLKRDFPHSLISPTIVADLSLKFS
jgi:hypothetical protein